MNLPTDSTTNLTDENKIDEFVNATEAFFTNLINRLSLEGESNTPDFMMGRLLARVSIRIFHEVNLLINKRFAHSTGVPLGTSPVMKAAEWFEAAEALERLSPLWIPNGDPSQTAYTKENVGVQADWESHDDYIVALALAGDETAIHNAAGCGFGRITDGKFVADEQPRRRLTAKNLEIARKAMIAAREKAAAPHIYQNIDKPAPADDDFELARSVHRVIRAMHDGNCPACGHLAPSTLFEQRGEGFHQYGTGSHAYKIDHVCPMCKEKITAEEAEAGLAMFHKYMRRNWERFKQWVANRRDASESTAGDADCQAVQDWVSKNFQYKPPQETSLTYDDNKKRIDVTIWVTDELIAEPKAFREWSHTELRHKLDEFLGQRQPPYSAPFTTDVPNCCGDPDKCSDPCQPPDNEPWTVDELEQGSANGNWFAYYVINPSQSQSQYRRFECESKDDAQWLANELNGHWRRQSTATAIGQSYRVAYSGGTEIEPDAAAFVLRLDGAVNDRTHLKACWAAARAFIEHYRFHWPDPALPAVPAKLEAYLNEHGPKLAEENS